MAWIVFAAAVGMAIAYMNVRRQRKAKENARYVAP
jgi:hypothetical protein